MTYSNMSKSYEEIRLRIYNDINTIKCESVMFKRRLAKMSHSLSKVEVDIKECLTKSRPGR